MSKTYKISIVAEDIDKTTTEVADELGVDPKAIVYSAKQGFNMVPYEKDGKRVAIHIIDGGVAEEVRQGGEVVNSPLNPHARESIAPVYAKDSDVVLHQGNVPAFEKTPEMKCKGLAKVLKSL